MKQQIKKALNRICQLIVLPLVIPCKLEEWCMSRHAETVFHTCTHIVALLPGLPGMFLRRAFYSLTLESCSTECSIGIGALFTHRNVTVVKPVYIGNYSMIGAAHLGEHCLLASRVSILSGKTLHTLDENERWLPLFTRENEKNHANAQCLGRIVSSCKPFALFQE